MCNVCKPAVYLYTNSRGRVIYASVLFHATLCMMFVANLNYIGELIYIFIQKLVGRAIYLRSEA